MKSLIDRHPLVKQADAKLADLERRRAEFEARVVPKAKADAEAQRAYDEAVDKALLEDGPMPEPPVRKIPEGREVELRNGFMRDRQRLDEERRQAVGAAYPDVLASAREQAAEVVTAARPVLEQLMAIMANLGALQGDVKICRDAANDPNARHLYSDSRFDMNEFIRIVRGEADPFGVVDLRDGRTTRSNMTGAEVARQLNRQ